VWVDVPHAQALAMALEHQVSAYDARFVACARRLSAPLVTEDSRLRAATPGLSMSIAEAVSRSAA
jgi:predicted nucleic acid-binding protein